MDTRSTGNTPVHASLIWVSKRTRPSPITSVRSIESELRTVTRRDNADIRSARILSMSVPSLPVASEFPRDDPHVVRAERPAANPQLINPYRSILSSFTRSLTGNISYTMVMSAIQMYLSRNYLAQVHSTATADSRFFVKNLYKIYTVKCVLLTSKSSKCVCLLCSVRIRC